MPDLQFDFFENIEVWPIVFAEVVKLYELEHQSEVGYREKHYMDALRNKKQY